ncbi:MAG TPA: hydrogenase maturation nickel metallochaperone HypA [Thermoanaerobaculia bacterium]|nr:hydrogenase maturation nickel metallochaperone HypA [Thermoanaerobaculia bacterium]
MHEYSLVQSLIELAEHQARDHGASRIDRLEVAIGELSGVETELLARAYDTFRDRTLCSGAELVIHPVAARWACPGCGRTSDRGAALLCPDCDLPLRLEKGEEIVLERIELEVA